MDAFDHVAGGCGDAFAVDAELLQELRAGAVLDELVRDSQAANLDVRDVMIVQQLQDCAAEGADR